MSEFARKVVLPQFEVTELADAADINAKMIAIHPTDNTPGGTYFIRPQMVPNESIYRDSQATWVATRFTLYPVILSGDGTPWPEANMWILSLLKERVHPNMSSFTSIAEDLTAYLRFIEEKDVDWLDFPSQKLIRPTYRFNGHLKHLIQNQEISAGTARRRMSTIIRFYRWLIEEDVFSPKYPPWKDSDRYIEFKGNYGASTFKKVSTTDVSIRAVKQNDPYDECIEDGGKLRPLSQEEQHWLMEALSSLGNTEMTLIHLFGLVTGARIQTILTFRVKDVLKDIGPSPQGFLRYPIGPGTGIDTKFDKKMVLHIPIWFYEMLHIYALSARARKRRLKAKGGDIESQYLFLSIRGAPLYAARPNQSQIESNKIRHSKVGQGVRQYMTDYIIPYIQKKYDARFHYRFHDLRATFGMNLVDERLKLVEEGKTTLKEVIVFVQTRMGHASSATTEKYLNYRGRLHIAHVIQNGWELRLEQMARNAMDQAHGRI